MGSACAAPAEDKDKNTQGEKKYKPEADTEQLAGKAKYISDVGAVFMQGEEGKRFSTAVTSAVVFVNKNLETVFCVHNGKTNAFYVSALTDDALAKVKDDCQVSFTFTAVFKSIATELVKGRAKITIKDKEDTAAIEFAVTSVKDAKTTQRLTLTLKREHGDVQALSLKYLITPITMMVQKRRQATEDKDKELKTCKLHSQGMIQEASIAKNKGIVDRIQPIIVPLREESTGYAKASAELVAKIASCERRIRKLHSAAEKNPIDGLYEDGGARWYQHCPDAEDHVPHVKRTADWDSLCDVLKSRFPLKEGEDLPSLQKAPADPLLAQLYDKCPADMLNNTMKALQNLDEWHMSVFDLEKATGGCALQTITYAILYKLDLINRLGMDDQKLRTFLVALQSGYHPNPYHNATHAADVTQVNYFIMIRGGLAEKCKLSQEEIFAGVLSGAIHDYDHPGFNNNFHTRTNAYLSTLYSDRSILENHHLACVFEMIRNPKYNIFSHLKEEQYREIRDTMTEMVLSTDMGLHGRIFSTFRRRLGECPEWHERKDDIRLALSMSIKMSDISNCGRPKHLYLEWAKNIATEFYNQGDVEQKLCIPISPFMDRRKDKQEFPKGQISFMNFIVVPMFEAISEFLPPVECSLQCCTENKEYWQQQE